MDKRLLQIALMFALIHIGDSDCLGDAARDLHALIKNNHPEIDINELTEYDC
jgi:hypothetical protein